jgi:ABC-type transporter Mla subunit MlaD
MAQAADQMSAKMTQAADQLTVKLAQAAQQLGDKMAASAENAGTQVKASADSMSGSLETLSDIIAKLEAGVNAMQSCAAAMDTSAKSMEAQLTKYNQGLSDGMDSFKAGIQNSVSDTFKIIDEQLAQAAGTLGTSANDIAEAAAKIPKAIRGLE